MIETSSVSQDLSKNDMDLCKMSEVDTEATDKEGAEHREDVLMICVRGAVCQWSLCYIPCHGP